MSPSKALTAGNPLSKDELRLMDAWWRAANYLGVGQIYLTANPLLRELGAWHLYKMAPSFEIAYNPDDQLSRDRAYQAWRKLLKMGRLPPKAGP